MKRGNSQTRDAYTVVLEDLHSQFKVFGGSLDLVRQENKQQTVKLDRMETDLELVKTELALIRHNLITREEFKYLETRIVRLERKIR